MMKKIKYPFVDDNGIPPNGWRNPHKTEEEKQKAYKAIEESIKRTKLLSQKQNNQCEKKP